MSLFTYTLRDQFGRPQTGTRESASAAALAEALRTQGLLVLTVETAEDPNEGEGASFDVRQLLPVRSVDVELALRQIAVMLRSGLTLLIALRTAAENADRPRFRQLLLQVSKRIEEGSSFADAMADHKVFDRLVVQLVRVGEATGFLDTVLARSAETLERRRQLRSQVLAAVGYPTVTLAGAIAVAAFMVLKVVPKLAEFLAVMGRGLPPSTQALVDLSNGIQAHGAMAGSLFVAALITGVLAYLTPQGRLACDTLLLRLPVVGKLLRVAGTALFARAFAILIGSGVTVLEALRTVEDVVRNRMLNAVIVSAQQRVFSGGGLAETLARKRGFMPMLSRMVAVGEASGTLDDVLDEVALFYEAQLAWQIKRFTALMEPTIIVVVGGVVGYVYISFFLALYSVAGHR